MKKKCLSKRILAGLISLCILTTTCEVSVSADNQTDAFQQNTINDGAISTTASSSVIVQNVINQYKFRSPKGGHGFAAERGNTLVDKIKGANTRVVGDNNVKNGPDREIINRDGSKVLIQDKYYKSAKEGINACFDENGNFRYVDGDGNLMQIEVPKDQYAEAVAEMQTKIQEGKIPGVSDPDEASTLVREGNLTYAQAKNLAKAGTLESLSYDAATGAVAAGCAFGISTLLNYATCRMNGMERSEAISVSAKEGVKSGAGAFCTAVIAGQLSKTAVIDIFKPSTEALTQKLGADFSKKLIEAFGQKVLAQEGETLAVSATKQAAKLLRSQGLVVVVTTVVFTAPDLVDTFRGRISKKQFVKNFAVTAVSVVAGTVGYGVGGFVGSLVVPGVGTLPAGIVGSIVFGTGGAIAADLLADYITSDDADEMYEIVQDEFVQLAEDYMINEEEAKNIIEQLNGQLTEDMFKDMYQSKDRQKFAVELLDPLFEKTIVARRPLADPSEAEMRASLLKELDGIVFVH